MGEVGLHGIEPLLDVAEVELAHGGVADVAAAVGGVLCLSAAALDSAEFGFGLASGFLLVFYYLDVFWFLMG